jgi:hypothetical protein
MRIRALLAFTAAALATSCASQRFDGPDGDRLFYEARCGACHMAWPRESHAPAQWPSILDEMAPRAGLTRSQRERITRYLTGS